MLTQEQRNLWDLYEQVEARGLRADKLRALVAFLDRLTETPESDWFPWARSLAEAVVDKGELRVIRTPLFVRAVFPALLAGFRAGLPGCARWLAGLFDLVCRNQGCLEQLPEVDHEVVLLRAALRQDPADRWSRRQLLKILGDTFEYSLHELPAAVLYGPGVDALSPEQCLELEQELDEFRLLVRAEGEEQLYEKFIRKCRFHFRAYRDYLLSPGDCRNYAEYLAHLDRQGPG